MGTYAYNEEDYNRDNFDEGDYRLKISGIEEKTSSKGSPMIVVEVIIKEAEYTFKHYLVQGKYFNANCTRFFDCFKIQRGDFNFQHWVGKYGKGHVAKGKPRDNGKSYWELQYIIVDQVPGSTARPAQRQAAPAPQPQQTRAPSSDGFIDDVPF